MLNEDYRDILQALADEKVKFLLGRIGIITAVSGLRFEETYARSLAVDIEGIEVHVPLRSATA